MREIKRWILIAVILASLSSIIGLTRFFSQQDRFESNQQSSRIVHSITETLLKHDIPINRKDVFWTTSANLIVRKAAHFIVFMLTGLILCILLNLFSKRLWLTFSIAIAVSIILAYLDEYRQKFSPGRSPNWSDVWIDTSGALTGIIFTTVYFLIYNKIISLKSKIKGLEETASQLVKT